jgi:hypothetical protein
LACFAVVVDVGCNHVSTVVSQRRPRELPEFKWAKTIPGNLKTTLSGAYKAFKYGKYADSCLGAFAYRFNRHIDLRGLVARLIVEVARCEARSRTVIRQVETHF